MKIMVKTIATPSWTMVSLATQTMIPTRKSFLNCSAISQPYMRASKSRCRKESAEERRVGRSWVGVRVRVRVRARVSARARVRARVRVRVRVRVGVRGGSVGPARWPRARS